MAKSWWEQMSDDKYVWRSKEDGCWLNICRLVRKVFCLFVYYWCANKSVDSDFI